MKKKPSKRRKPAAKKTGKKPGTNLVKQPHGGAIHQGPAANVVPGPGRPPSAIRAALARSFDERRPIYEEIADGLATERIEVELEEVAKLIVCGGCGAPFVPKKETPIERMVISAWRSARTRDRLRAMDSMGKLGIGITQTQEFTDIRQHPDAQRFFNCYHRALAELLSPEVVEKVVKRVDELLQVAEPTTS